MPSLHGWSLYLRAYSWEQNMNTDNLITNQTNNSINISLPNENETNRVTSGVEGDSQMARGGRPYNPKNIFLRRYLRKRKHFSWHERQKLYFKAMYYLEKIKLNEKNGTPHENAERDSLNWQIVVDDYVHFKRDKISERRERLGSARKNLSATHVVNTTETKSNSEVTSHEVPVQPLRPTFTRRRRRGRRRSRSRKRSRSEAKQNAEQNDEININIAEQNETNVFENSTLSNVEYDFNKFHWQRHTASSSNKNLVIKPSKIILFNGDIKDPLCLALASEKRGLLKPIKEEWSMVETKLLELIRMHLLMNENSPTPHYESAKIYEGYRVIECENTFSKEFLCNSLNKINDGGIDFTVKLIPLRNIAKRRQVERNHVLNNRRSIRSKPEYPHSSRKSDSVKQSSNRERKRTKNYKQSLQALRMLRKEQRHHITKNEILNAMKKGDFQLSEYNKISMTETNLNEQMSKSPQRFSNNLCKYDHSKADDYKTFGESGSSINKDLYDISRNLYPGVSISNPFRTKSTDDTRSDDQKPKLCQNLGFQLTECYDDEPKGSTHLNEPSDEFHSEILGLNELQRSSDKFKNIGFQINECYDDLSQNSMRSKDRKNFGAEVDFYDEHNRNSIDSMRNTDGMDDRRASESYNNLSRNSSQNRDRHELGYHFNPDVKYYNERLSSTVDSPKSFKAFEHHSPERYKSFNQRSKYYDDQSKSEISKSYRESTDSYKLSHCLNSGVDQYYDHKRDVASPMKNTKRTFEFSENSNHSWKNSHSEDHLSINNIESPRPWNMFSNGEMTDFSRSAFKDIIPNSFRRNVQNPGERYNEWHSDSRESFRKDLQFSFLDDENTRNDFMPRRKNSGPNNKFSMLSDNSEDGYKSPPPPPPSMRRRDKRKHSFDRSSLQRPKRR